MSENFRVSCHSCGQNYIATDEYEGVFIVCSNCQVEFLVVRSPLNLPESYMSIEEATSISDNFTGILAEKQTTYAPVSLLPASKERIVKALMIWIAQAKREGCLDKVRGLTSTMLSGGLAFFIEDDVCELANNATMNKGDAIHSREWTAVRSSFMAEFTYSVNKGEIDNFLRELDQISSNDPLYWQKIYSLAGVSFAPPESKKKSFWSGLFGG
jgi:hypothetical protein